MNSRNPIKTTRAPLAAVAAAFVLAACTPAVNGWTEAENPKVIDVQRLEGSLTIAAANGVLAGDEMANLDRFLANQGNLSNLRVTLTPRRIDSGPAVDAVENHLIARGVRTSHIARSEQLSGGAGDVLVVAEHYVAAAPNCPDWTHGNILDGANQNSSNFGCATQNGLARMIADPRDLVVGRSFDGVDGNRSVQAVGRYRTDEVKELPTNINKITTSE